MVKFLSGLVKLFLGVVLAIALMGLGGIAATRYFMARLTLLPSRPVFENDEPSPEAEPEVATPEPQNASETQTPPTPIPEPVEEEFTLTESEIEAGAYKAQVVQPIGLILRAGPGRDYPQVGGVEYDEEVIVLNESPDQGWLQVRLPSLGIEGWIINGNTQQVN